MKRILLPLLILSSLPLFGEKKYCLKKNVDKILVSMELAASRFDFLSLNSYHDKLYNLCSDNQADEGQRWKSFLTNISNSCDSSCYVGLVDYYGFLLSINDLTPGPSKGIEELSVRGQTLASMGIKNLMHGLESGGDGESSRARTDEVSTPSCVTSVLPCEFDNNNFFDFMSRLVKLKLARAKILIYEGDHFHQTVKAPLNQYMISTASSDGIDSKFRSAGIRYTMAMKSIIDAMTDIPGNQMPELAGKANSLLEKVETRMEAINKGYYFPSINPFSVSSKTLFELKSELNDKISRTRNIEDRIANRVKELENSGISVANMEQNEKRWVDDEQIAIKSQTLAAMNAKIAQMSSQASSIRTQIEGFDWKNRNAETQVNYELQLTSLQLETQIQEDRIKREESIQLNSEMLSSALDERQSIRYKIDRASADYHLTNEIVRLQAEEDRLKNQVIRNLELELAQMRGDPNNLDSTGILGERKNELKILEAEKNQLEVDRKFYSDRISFTMETALTEIEKQKDIIENRIDILEKIGVKQDDICSLQNEIKALIDDDNNKTLEDIIEKNQTLKLMYENELELARIDASNAKSQVDQLKNQIAYFKVQNSNMKDIRNTYEAALLRSRIEALVSKSKAIAGGMISEVNLIDLGAYGGTITGTIRENKVFADESEVMWGHLSYMAESALQFGERQLEYVNNLKAFETSLERLENSLTAANLAKSIASLRTTVKLAELGDLEDTQSRKLGIERGRSQLATYTCERDILNLESTLSNAQEQLHALEYRLLQRSQDESYERNQLSKILSAIKVKEESIANKKSEIERLNIELDKLNNTLLNEKNILISVTKMKENLLDLQSDIEFLTDESEKISKAISSLRSKNYILIRSNTTNYVDELKSLFDNKEDYFNRLKSLSKLSSSTNDTRWQQIDDLNSSINALQFQIDKTSKEIVDSLTSSLEKDQQDSPVQRFSRNQKIVRDMLPNLADLVEERRQLLYESNIALAEYTKKVSLSMPRPEVLQATYLTSSTALHEMKENIDDAVRGEKTETFAQHVYIDLTGSPVFEDLAANGETYFSFGDVILQNNPYQINSPSFNSYHHKRIIDVRFIFDRRCDLIGQIPVTLTHMGMNHNDRFVSGVYRYEYFFTESYDLPYSMFFSRSLDSDFDQVREIDRIARTIGGVYMTNPGSLGERSDAVRFPLAGRAVNGLWKLHYPFYVDPEGSLPPRRIPTPCKGEESQIEGLGVHIWFIGEQNQ
ncbi:hypothetical protein [Pseudobacteriovorax antillogorgiicola]|uniref:Uncharacterized protein n=1 Tax=Pseudobacteriovorax antillogorgiicola TaxID=1513793 RepID=A0A1Y6C378_9BACT|nr:hypothetical protein [Pseudobacteriovorax antillogorgiicola]TCS50784.1 hypothetical protein EDD56_112167 [Pseudobacteriovorax antillogorgiicola]SMF41477.1 hypothetical protein SAMN06296036_112166 [Pseudobacteriovorax antillogorgiicola]